MLIGLMLQIIGLRMFLMADISTVQVRAPLVDLMFLRRMNLMFHLAGLYTMWTTRNMGLPPGRCGD